MSIYGWLVTAAAATTTTTTEVAARGAAIALLGFIDLQRATAEVFAIESLHGALGVSTGHLDEAEATGASGLAIVYQGHLVDGAVGSEVGAHLIFGGVKRQISNVKFRHKQLTNKRDRVAGKQPCRLVRRQFFEVSTPQTRGRINQGLGNRRGRYRICCSVPTFSGWILYSARACTPAGRRPGL